MSGIWRLDAAKLDPDRPLFSSGYVTWFFNTETEALQAEANFRRGLRTPPPTCVWFDPELDTVRPWSVYGEETPGQQARRHIRALYRAAIPQLAFPDEEAAA